ncbi:unnamed protein product [Alternaria burnsii]|nr:unnamed protein product [Alternaria burnsii]
MPRNLFRVQRARSATDVTWSDPQVSLFPPDVKVCCGRVLVGETLNMLHVPKFKENQREEIRWEDMQSWTSIPSGSSKVETHPTY